MSFEKVLKNQIVITEKRLRLLRATLALWIGEEEVRKEDIKLPKPPKKRKRKIRLSRFQRNAISKRMKEYWKKQRTAKKSGGAK